MEASEYGHTKIEELLLKHGADIDMKDNNGNTALMLSYNTKIDRILRSYADRDQYSHVKTVPFSAFNEGKAGEIFAKVRRYGSIIVIDNDGNEIYVITSPEAN